MIALVQAKLGGWIGWENRELGTNPPLPWALLWGDLPGHLPPRTFALAPVRQSRIVHWRSAPHQRLISWPAIAQRCEDEGCCLLSLTPSHGRRQFAFRPTSRTRPS